MMVSMTNAADIFVGEAIRDNIVRPWMGDRSRSATMAMADMMLLPLRYGVCPFSMVDLYIYDALDISNCVRVTLVLIACGGWRWRRMVDGRAQKRRKVLETEFQPLF
jgi:hypothetical protein